MSKNIPNGGHLRSLDFSVFDIGTDFRIIFFPSISSHQKLTKSRSPTLVTCTLNWAENHPQNEGAGAERLSFFQSNRFATSVPLVRANFPIIVSDSNPTSQIYLQHLPQNNGTFICTFPRSFAPERGAFLNYSISKSFDEEAADGKPSEQTSVSSRHSIQVTSQRVVRTAEVIPKNNKEGGGR